MNNITVTIELNMYKVLESLRVEWDLVQKQMNEIDRTSDRETWERWENLYAYRKGIRFAIDKIKEALDEQSRTKEAGKEE